ncbi:MAG: nucleotidyltransferase family protein [Phycisphaerales bacterium]|nr:MAG: nucleotidyltransferase family protein [Phycisphaerales bacterium]
MSGSQTPQSLLAMCLAGRVADVPKSVDWLHLADGAGSLGLSGLVLEALDRAGLRVHETAYLALREQSTVVAGQNAHITRCFKPIARAFDAAGIPLLLLKGAALGLTVYREPRLRPMSDVDCMVRCEHLDQVCALLKRLGCRRGADLVRRDFFPRYFNEVEYFTPDRRSVRIDLHVRPFRPLRYAQTVPADAFWRGAVPADLGGAVALMPNPSDMVIHLAVHAAVHGARRPLWLYDIYRFAHVHRDTLDWTAVIEQADAWRLVLPLRVALQRVDAMFGPAVPPDVIATLDRRRVGLADRLTLWHAPRDEAHPMGHLLVDLLCTRGWRFRLGYLAAVLLPGRPHLESIYAGRHPGWTLCAHACRVMRAIRRALGLRVDTA